MAGGYTQPNLRRLLAIHCLENAVFIRPTWENDNGASDAAACQTIIQVTRNISRLCTGARFRKMGEYLQRLFPDKVKWTWADDSFLVDDKGTKITPSHIKGDAYEILCATIFQCKSKTPLVIRDYYSNEDQPIDVECRVTNVLLSNEEGLDDAFKWRSDDYNGDAKSYIESNVGDYLRKRGASHAVAKEITDILSKNITNDLGFDIFVELEEVGNSNKHYVLAQCKYRSNENVDAGMSVYIGKYYEIVHLFDQIHDQLKSKPNIQYSPTLLPFFWMSTESDPDSMQYFTHLCKSGRIRLYGNVAMSFDEVVCNLIQNVHGYTKAWKQKIKSSGEEHIFKYRKKKNLRDYQALAVQDVLQYYQNGIGSENPTEHRKHTSIIMATGAGKTLTSLECVRALESDEKVNLLSRVQEGKLAASLHFSPMIRLVLQNAHEWLAQELAIHGNSEERFKMIYYCICSLKKERNAVAFSGCTAVRLIETSKVYEVFRNHRARGDLHFCRFFTTYQASKALKIILRRINLELYQTNPNHCLFGASVRDEAHTAAGRGGKVYSASLYIDAHVGLSFTASPKYDFNHLKHIFPDKYDTNLPENQGMHTYWSLDMDKAFPQVDYEIARPYIESNENYSDADYRWDPVDLLSEDFLFEKVLENGIFDWGYFQALGNPAGSLVFYVDDSKIVHKDQEVDCFDVLLDDNGDPKYFGVSGSEDAAKVCSETQCYGVNQTLTTLYKPHGNSRGFHMHDMTGLGSQNKLGPVIHKIGYSKLFEEKRLAEPSLIMLRRRHISEQEFGKFKIRDSSYLDAIFGEIKTEKGAKLRQPDKVKWKLTIANTIVESTAHAFRAMKLLYDCFFLFTDNPIKTALVFCSKTEQSKECQAIFAAMLKKGVETGKLQPSQKENFFTGIIYTSDSSAQDDEAAMMAYDAQQHTISSFCEAAMGVLFNVRLIGIGVDLPDVDAALIVNPGDSVSDITQRIGRALRPDPDVNKTKVAKVLVPALDATDMASNPEVTEEISSGPPSMSDNNPPSTPAHYPSSSRDWTAGTPEIAHNSCWRVPVNIPFEDRFFLQLKVLAAMRDKNIHMISSFFEGAGKAEIRHKGDDLKHRSGNQLIADLKGSSQGDAFVPTFDESFSEFLLSVWDAATIKFDAQIRAAGKNIPHNYEENRRTSKAFMFIVLATCCHHRSDYERKDITDDDKSFLWYKTSKPFEKKIPINELKRLEDTHHDKFWTLFDFKDADEFEKAILTENGHHMQVSSMRNKYHRLEEEDRKEIVNTFLHRLKDREEVHADSMEILCNVWKQNVKGYNCEHTDHKICGGFGFATFDDFTEMFRDLLEREDAWMKSTLKPASMGTHNASTCTKRKSHELSDSDNDDVMSPESMEIDQSIYFNHAAGSRRSSKSVPKRSTDAHANLLDAFENAASGSFC